MDINQWWLEFKSIINFEDDFLPSGGTKIIDPPPHNGISVGGLHILYINNFE
jgi:hypothetical protein